MFLFFGFISTGNISRVAAEELLRDAHRASERASNFGSTAWQRSPVPKHNRTFLNRAIAGAVTQNAWLSAKAQRPPKTTSLTTPPSDRYGSHSCPSSSSQNQQNRDYAMKELSSSSGRASYVEPSSSHSGGPRGDHSSRSSRNRERSRHSPYSPAKSSKKSDVASCRVEYGSRMEKRKSSLEGGPPLFSPHKRHARMES